MTNYARQGTDEPTDTKSRRPRATKPSPRLDLWTQRITRWLTALMHWISSHWLALANLAVGWFLGLPLLAPVLLHAGYTRLGNVIHLIYRPLCHQLPERSIFFWGPQPTYSFDELSGLLGRTVPPRYVGDTIVGFKTAVCQRDVAIYGTALLCGLLFQLVRSRLRPISFRVFVAMLVPIGIDGFGQLLGFWTSSWTSRTITGALFGAACVLLAYPYLENGMADVRAETGATLKRWRG